jgi:hypothetical protein
MKRTLISTLALVALASTLGIASADSPAQTPVQSLPATVVTPIVVPQYNGFTPSLGGQLTPAQIAQEQAVVNHQRFLDRIAWANARIAKKGRGRVIQLREARY